MLIFFKCVPATGQRNEQKSCIFVMMLPNKPMKPGLIVHAYSPRDMGGRGREISSSRAS